MQVLDVNNLILNAIIILNILFYMQLLCVIELDVIYLCI